MHFLNVFSVFSHKCRSHHHKELMPYMSDSLVITEKLTTSLRHILKTVHQFTFPHHHARTLFLNAPDPTLASADLEAIMQRCFDSSGEILSATGSDLPMGEGILLEKAPNSLYPLPPKYM